MRLTIMIIIHINSNSTQFTIIFQIWNFRFSCKQKVIIGIISWCIFFKLAMINRASIFLMHSFKTNLFDFHILMTCKEWYFRECWFFGSFSLVFWWWNATLLRLLWLEHRERDEIVLWHIRFDTGKLHSTKVLEATFQKMH